MRTIEGSEELLRIVDDVDTNHKMRRCLVIRVKKLNKLSGRLGKLVRLIIISQSWSLTGRGPSSKELAKTPVGASQMSAGFLHLYEAEQTSGPLGLTPGGYTGLTPGLLDD